jgi:hypothetical protein
MRGISREPIMCTWYVAIEVIIPGKYSKGDSKPKKG